MTEHVYVARNAEMVEHEITSAVTRELGPNPPEDLVAYRRPDEYLQSPGTIDETGFCEGGVV